MLINRLPAKKTIITIRSGVLIVIDNSPVDTPLRIVHSDSAELVGMMNNSTILGNLPS